MKKQWWYLGASALVVAVGLLVGSQYLPDKNANTNTTNQVNVSRFVTTEITNGTSTQSYEYAPVSSETALAMLQRIALEKNITLDLKHFSFGDLVNGINGVMGNDATGYYWSFYVNDKLADVGASAYMVQPGDTIAWRYQKL